MLATPAIGLWSFQTPEDDPLPSLLELLRGAKQAILICAYGFTLAEVVDELIAAQRRGVEVRLILDASQAAGKAEQVQIRRLRAASVPFVTGRSERGGIIHLKQAIVDGRYVWTGSWNWSASASKQDNDCYLVALPHAADKRLAKFEKEWKRLGKTRARAA